MLDRTPNCRLVSNIPLNELYLGFKVRSLFTGNIGIVGNSPTMPDELYIWVLWKNNNVSVQKQHNYCYVEEILEEII